MSIADPRIVELDHALVKHHLSLLRNEQTPPSGFRQQVRLLSALLAYEVTRNLPVKPVQIRTPLEETTCFQLSSRIAVCPILRAGLGMVEPLVDLIPDLEVWHLGVYRDEETATPVHYYDKLPAVNPPDLAIIADPMLATGGSICLAAEAIQKWGVRQLMVMSLISTPEGLARVTAEFPAIRIVTCCIDRGLDHRKYILPGLGDAGDRIFNT